ncbi:hypothetical protein WJX73_010652 [Symbiochloris irregularis]|uniref:Uncharacterized protein n=1 Tax=Symbiochloris irregularis TaxID=706552 RepID=A0AAW1NVN4_9CHLO
MATCVRQGRFEEATAKAKISSSRDLEFFRREAALLCLLQHPNMTALLAARLLPPEYLLVMELGAKELASMIHHEGWRSNPKQLIHLASQLAEVLAYLHAKGVLHRDINPSNILLDGAENLKLTDFSIAEYADELAEEQADRRHLLKGAQPTGGFHKRHLVGTLQYLAPEILLKQPAGYAADIYAWAVTVNELATGTFPFSDCTHDNPQAHTILDFGYGRSELAAAVAAEGLRPTLAPSAPPQLNDLITRCWALDPDQRPTASDLAPSFELKVTAAAEASAGLRGEDRMEDRHLLLTPLHIKGKLLPSTQILATFDGHRGAAAAEHCVQHLLQHLQACWDAPTAEAALQDTFLRLDKAFLESQQRSWDDQVQRKGQSAAGTRTWPGCTAIVALIHDGHLWVANAGDCRAVLVTRSIGDGDLKPLGLTARPEVSHHQLEEGDTCLLLGSDGLWDYLPSQAAADLIRDTVKHPAMCARRLITEALTRGSGDNVTAIVAFLQPVTTLERIYG